MDTKRIVFLMALLCSIGQGRGQSSLGLSISTSKNDRHMETIWFQQQLSDRFSMGLQLRNSGIRYRFVNARAIEEGNTLFIGVVVGLKVKESESYRLDFNLTTSYRRLQNDDKVELPENTDGLEIDPNIIMTLPLNDRLFFHTGAMLRLAMQTGPESIGNEQGLSAIVLNGLSLRSGSNVFSLKTYAGPMNGATGDTEKFFWQVALSYQFSLSGKNSASLPFFNF